MKRIVVVEDNPDNRLLVRAILEERYAIVEFETGAERLVPRSRFASKVPLHG